MIKNKELIYHYTSANALLSILKNKILWATNIRYMNDSSEFNYALEICKKYMWDRFQENYCQAGNNYKIFGYEIYQLEEVFSCLYVFSLSKKADDLNQWRSYSLTTQGYCIGLNLDMLKQLCKKRKWKLIKCNYSEKSQKRIIFRYVDKVAGEISSIPNPHDFNESPLLKNSINELQNIASTIKNKSFCEEDEYRIIVNNESNKLAPNFREGISMITPYVELRLSDEEAIQIISKVIVGPTPHPELSKESIKVMLKQYGYINCDVEITNIPFRKW